MAADILLVEPENSALVAAIEQALAEGTRVGVCKTFRTARAILLSDPPSLLVTNLRLHDYNGLHLVLLAPPATRCVVYAATDDLLLARETQAAGAFYERQDRLPVAVQNYLTAGLPGRDRRNVAVLDRRRAFRGGRRCTDVANLVAGDQELVPH